MDKNDQENIDLHEQIMAEISRLIAETGRITAEGRKLGVEANKISAETSKISAETSKINAENRWYPMVIAASGAASFTLVIVAIVKLFL